MKQYKKPVALVAALALMATLLAGCGSGGSGGDAAGDADKKAPAPKTPQEVIALVQKNTQAAKSLSYTMTMDMEMKMTMAEQELPMSVKMDMTADMINDPMQLTVDYNMDMGDQGSQAMKMYAEEVDGTSTLYMSMDDGATWSPSTMDAIDMAQFDASEGLDFYIDIIKDVKEGSPETVNGVTATKYDCVIPNEDLNKVMEASGALDSFSTLPGMDAESISAMLTDLGDLTFTIWVDTEKYLPVQYSIDMTEIMSNLMSKMMTELGDSVAGLEIAIDKTLVQMTVTGVDTVTSIERPEGIAATPAA